MKASEWFLLHFEIHRRSDEWGMIQVFDDGNKRYLSFGTADEQSCQLKHKPLQLQHDYSRAMLASLLMFGEQAPRRMTMLGLGGGSLPHTVHELLPDCQIDVAELRPAVVQVARQYFQLPRSPRLHIHTGDAGAWLDDAEAGQCDWLMSDLFLSDGLDQQQLQTDFLDRCHRHLKPAGWLVLNLWREHRDQADWLNHLKRQFDQVLHATTKDGNWIVWARKADSVDHADGTSATVTESDAKQQAKHWSASVGFNLWQSARPFFKHRQKQPKSL